jgi:hypothetical protein
MGRDNVLYISYRTISLSILQINRDDSSRCMSVCLGNKRLTTQVCGHKTRAREKDSGQRSYVAMAQSKVMGQRLREGRWCLGLTVGEETKVGENMRLVLDSSYYHTQGLPDRSWGQGGGGVLL